ncbi:MAG TPA: hypothetical protein VMF59_10650 [Bacteroidota bacterium]|nr:hypothetical protein [Bacteroidota bacterium]
MQRSSRTILFLFLAGAFLTGTLPAQEQFSLQYRLEKGKVYRFADTTLVKSSQEMMGQEVKSTSTVLTTTRLVPAEINADGSTVITVSPDVMKINIKNARMDTTLVPQEMIGKRTRLTISKIGETLSREIVDSVKMSGLAAQTGRQDMVRLHVMPSKPIMIGEKWATSKPDTFDAQGGKMVTVSTGESTLLAREKKNGVDCFKVTYTGKLVITGKGTMNGMDFFVEGNGATSGTYFMDVNSGMTVEEESQYNVESTVAITGAQNMTIPGSQSVTAHRRLLKD